MTLLANQDFDHTRTTKRRTTFHTRLGRGIAGLRDVYRYNIGIVVAACVLPCVLPAAVLTLTGVLSPLLFAVLTAVFIALGLFWLAVAHTMLADIHAEQAIGNELRTTLEHTQRQRDEAQTCLHETYTALVVYQDSVRQMQADFAEVTANLRTILHRVARLKARSLAQNSAQDDDIPSLFDITERKN